MFNLTRSDNQVAASTTQVDHSLWTCVSNPKSEVCTISSRVGPITQILLSYISEAAVSLLDTRLNLHIVPRTELVSFSSPAFFYDWIDRAAGMKGKPLPEKIGSLQYFLHGYTDASIFLREHPWPGRSISDTFDGENHRSGVAMKRVMHALQIVCGRTGEENELHEEDEEDEQTRALYDVEDTGDFYWSLALQQDFRLELEKLIILGTPPGKVHGSHTNDTYRLYYTQYRSRGG